MRKTFPTFRDIRLDESTIPDLQVRRMGRGKKPKVDKKVPITPHRAVLEARSDARKAEVERVRARLKKKLSPRVDPQGPTAREILDFLRVHRRDNPDTPFLGLGALGREIGLSVDEVLAFLGALVDSGEVLLRSRKNRRGQTSWDASAA